MPLVREEENATGRGGEEDGEEENGVREWGTRSHTCKTWLTQYVMNLEHS